MARKNSFKHQKLDIRIKLGVSLFLGICVFLLTYYKAFNVWNTQFSDSVYQKKSVSVLPITIVRIDEATLDALLATLNRNYEYFGYGYVKDRNDLVPSVPINFWAFRAMVGLGCLFILFFGLVFILIFDIPFISMVFRRLLSAFGLLPETASDQTTPADAIPNWLCWTAVLMVPLAYIASESGWLVAEFGRQPWTIQDMLPTWAAVSDLQSSSVMITFFLFLILFTTMLAVEISILIKQIKKGPEL